MNRSLLLTFLLIFGACSKDECQLPPDQSSANPNPFQALAGSYQGSGIQILSYMARDSAGNWQNQRDTSLMTFSAEVEDSSYSNALNYHLSFSSNWLHENEILQDSVVLDSQEFYRGNFQGQIYGGTIVIEHQADSLFLELNSGNVATACTFKLGALKKP